MEKLYGINTVKISSAEGIGFAIPINVVKPIIENFINNNSFEQATMGVYAYDKEVIPYLNNNISFSKGIFVAQIIKNGPADNTELKEGDIITSIDDKELNTMNDLREYIYNKKPNDLVNLKISRGKITKEVEIIKADIQNISDYENAIEYLAEDPAKSIEILLRLAEEFEENPLIYYYLGIGFRKLEDYNQAIYYLKESVKRESGILEVIVELGLNYACINEFEEAIKLFKKAFEASRDVEICTNIVMCYLNLNDLENAKLHLDIAKNLNPDDEIVKQLETMINK